MNHTCSYHAAYDPETLDPVGPACGKEAVQEIHWRDGRISPSCLFHGYQALDPEARAMVLKVTKPRTESEWVTEG